MPRTIAKIVFLALVLLLGTPLVLTLSQQPTSAQLSDPYVPRITVTPTSGYPGSSATLTGFQFPIQARINVIMAGGIRGTVISDARGSFAMAFTVPSVPPGTYTVEAKTTAEPYVTAATIFTVLAPSITVTPISGVPDSQVQVTGTQFPIQARIDVIMAGSTRGTVVSDSRGSFAMAFTIPSVPPGTYTVEARTTAEPHVTASTTFTVLAPSITITPGSGYPGSPVNVIGTGFPIYAPIDVIMGGGIRGTVISDSRGSFAMAFTIPSVPPGTYTVEAKTTAEPYVTAHTAFTVVAPLETVTTPFMPSGPGWGEASSLLIYLTGGSQSNLGHAVEYRFDWGDGTYSVWSHTSSASHAWLVPGTYNVRSQARCAIDNAVVSQWSGGTPVLIHEETVSVPDLPSGPSNGEVDDLMTYATGGSQSSLGHIVQYRFDWGDGTYSDWLSSSSASHSWTAAGDYAVQAQARCATHIDILSDWSEGTGVRVSGPTPTPTTTPTPVKVIEPDVTSGPGGPASIELANMVISPTEVGPGETVNISVEAANTGDAEGSCAVSLLVEGEVEDVVTITLAGGETTTVEFTVSREASGSYPVNIRDSSGEFTVMESVPGLRWSMVGGTIGGLLLLALLALLGRRVLHWLWD